MGIKARSGFLRQVVCRGLSSAAAKPERNCSAPSSTTVPRNLANPGPTYMWRAGKNDLIEFFARLTAVIRSPPATPTITSKPSQEADHLCQTGITPSHLAADDPQPPRLCQDGVPCGARETKLIKYNPFDDGDGGRGGAGAQAVHLPVRTPKSNGMPPPTRMALNYRPGPLGRLAVCFSRNYVGNVGGGRLVGQDDHLRQSQRRSMT